MASDLTLEEQRRVRAALRYLRVQMGTWRTVAQALSVMEKTLEHYVEGRTITGGVAIRVARLAGVSIDGLLAGGEYPPPGTCPHCGKNVEEPPARKGRH